MNSSNETGNCSECAGIDLQRDESPSGRILSVGEDTWTVEIAGLELREYFAFMAESRHKKRNTGEEIRR